MSAYIFILDPTLGILFDPASIPLGSVPLEGKERRCPLQLQKFKRIKITPPTEKASKFKSIKFLLTRTDPYVKITT
jgi:hypothetical protein